ncbi:hypothetical protein HORIV_62000 [Vreelandella olivaria]|uniref:Uncharacterized protein n=1 Tax=Vreelandella olivaria TaxID=390919 RepID=A0ABN5X3F2_9GAMM|nr:hypothetical protein HORIV_62000 [Halomonas olivaria]
MGHPWLGDNLHLQLNAKNLFDTTYYPSSGGSTRVVVGDPLEVSLQASVKFLISRRDNLLLISLCDNFHT